MIRRFLSWLNWRTFKFGWVTDGCWYGDCITIWVNTKTKETRLEWEELW